MQDTVTYPPFSPIFCPQQADLKTLLPDRSAYDVMSTATINPGDDLTHTFDNVLDPAYPWQNMPNYDPQQYADRLKVRDDKTAAVARYELDRVRFWKRISYAPLPPGMTSTLDISYTYGVDISHSETSTRTLSEEIGLNLGLNFSSGLLPSPVKAAERAFSGTSAIPSFKERTRTEERSHTPAPDSALLSKSALSPDALSEGSCQRLPSLKAGAFSAGGDVGFTYAVSQQLSFSVDDCVNYSYSVTRTESYTLDQGYFYFFWQLCEGLILYRVLKGSSERAEISHVTTATSLKQCQSLPLDMANLRQSRPGAFPPDPPLNTKDYVLERGDTHTYATKPAGSGKTYLYVQGNELCDVVISTRAILCCHGDKFYTIPKGHPKVTIELDGTGALNVVTNHGPASVTIWTNI